MALLRQLSLILVAGLCIGNGSCELLATIPFPFDEPFTLAFRQTRSSLDGNISVTFLEVLEDSRCPKDIICVWEGNAKVSLKVTISDIEHHVELNSALDPQAIQLGHYLISFKDLQPHPLEGVTVNREDYHLTIQVKTVPLE